MICHVEVHAVRTVEIRIPGGRDAPQSSLETFFIRLKPFVLPLLLLVALSLKNILGLTWHANFKVVLAGECNSR